MTVPEEPADRVRPTRRLLGRGPQEAYGGEASEGGERGGRALEQPAHEPSEDRTADEDFGPPPPNAPAPPAISPTETSGEPDPVQLPDAPAVPPATPDAPVAPDAPAGATPTAAPAGSAAYTAPAYTAPPDAEAAADDGRFKVVLENFEGPFDLLLQLIAKHKMDVTEVALSRVTDEFMAHLRAMGPDWDLDQTTEFLVVAATLLDLKAARLLPAAEIEDEADLALLEARDLLFARLLQYRAYKEIVEILSERMAAEARRHPRTVGLEPHHAELLPEVVIRLGPEGFAALAVKAMQPRPRPEVYVDHIHAPLVSVREQAELMVERLRAGGELSFAELTEDVEDTLTVVARFLALLELYRERAVALDQPEALGALMVRWSGEGSQRPVVSDEFDQETRPQSDAPAAVGTQDRGTHV
ncbi:segregation/condensation protein A [Streptomyces sp. XM4193]|uniref:segregation and condensation protein A n=1 Tax=Streptomyces sp. XM4193 TaxID=2929782 RepID=UPI001FF76B87|nr:ScpA family protein [Streptomyces sp. XM4193]MCK1799057.1 segregation/condensation protein A [Streptomyces sp. XM4193]